MLIEMVETMNKLTHNSYGLIFNEISFLFDIRIQVTVITILKDQVIIIISFFHVIEFDNVRTFTTLKNFDFALKKFFEFS